MELKTTRKTPSYKQTQFIVFTIILIISSITPKSAHAQGIVYGDTIPTGTTVDHDVVLIGQNIELAGTVNGNVFILGNQVAVTGNINGSLVLIGQNATIGGKVSGAVYSSALTLELSSGAALDRELYVTAVSLITQPGAIIGRDLFALGLDAGLNGKVGRDLHTSLGPIQLYNGLMHLLGFDQLTLKLHINFPPPGGGGSGNGVQIALINSHIHARIVKSPERLITGEAWIFDLLRKWIVLAFFSLLAIWLTHRPLEKAGLPLESSPIKTTAIGLVVFVIALNLFGVALLIAVFIFSIGLGLNFVGLWELSIALWIAAYACLALASIALWLFIVYGTKVIVVYLISNWLLNKFALTSIWLKTLTMLIGILLYLFLNAVPFVGWIIGMLVTAAGLGSAWLSYRTDLQNRQQLIPPLVERQATPDLKRKKVTSNH